MPCRNDEARVAFDRPCTGEYVGGTSHIRMHLDPLIRDSKRATSGGK